MESFVFFKVARGGFVATVATDRRSPQKTAAAQRHKTTKGQIKMTTPNIAPNYVLAAGVGVLANRTIENFTSNLAMLGAVNVAQKNGSELELASIMNVVMSYSQHYNTFSTPC